LGFLSLTALLAQSTQIRQRVREHNLESLEALEVFLGNSQNEKEWLREKPFNPAFSTINNASRVFASFKDK
jgi:hypothetical protein